ncbi:hypothetical protein ACLB2K_065936 [Fragaria x ananassa]
MEETNSRFNRICVFCGSSSGKKASYQEAAVELGKELVERRINLVYGGGSVGLMGLVSQAVHDGGRHVIGVIPRTLMPREITGETVGEVRTVSNMHQRKAEMARQADAFIALPAVGGTRKHVEHCEEDRVVVAVVAKEVLVEEEDSDVGQVPRPDDRRRGESRREGEGSALGGVASAVADVAEGGGSGGDVDGEVDGGGGGGVEKPRVAHKTRRPCLGFHHLVSLSLYSDLEWMTIGGNERVGGDPIGWRRFRFGRVRRVREETVDLGQNPISGVDLSVSLLFLSLSAAFIFFAALRPIPTTLDGETTTKLFIFFYSTKPSPYIRHATQFNGDRIQGCFIVFFNFRRVPRATVTAVGFPVPPSPSQRCLFLLETKTNMEEG